MSANNTSWVQRNRDRNSQENQRKAPNLRVFAGRRPGFDLELAGFRIAAVAVDAAEEELYLVRFEETPCGLSFELVGEGDDEDVAEEADTDGQNAFEDKDPSPAAVACYASLVSKSANECRVVDASGGGSAYHLLDAVGKDA